MNDYEKEGVYCTDGNCDGCNVPCRPCETVEQFLEEYNN